jgi:hypothetical protein
MNDFNGIKLDDLQELKKRMAIRLELESRLDLFSEEVRNNPNKFKTLSYFKDNIKQERFMTEETHDALIKRFVAGDESAFYEIKALLNTMQSKFALGVVWGISAAEAESALADAFKFLSNNEIWESNLKLAKQNTSPQHSATQEEIQKIKQELSEKIDKNTEDALLELGLNPKGNFFSVTRKA